MKVGYQTKVEEEKIIKKGEGSRPNVISLPSKNPKNKMNKKYIIWHIEGGLGKNVAATGLITSLKRHYPDREIIMVVSYPEVFLNHPDISRVYRVGMTPYFYEDYIDGKDTLIFRHEPYFQSNHILHKKHLIENWCDLLGISYTKQLPIFYPNFVQKRIQDKWVRNRPVMVIHTHGGPIVQNTNYAWTRDMPYELALAISQKYKKDYHIIQICRNQAQALPDVEVVIDPMSNFELFSILAVSQKRVLIDSCMQHAAAAMRLPSTVLWVGTSSDNFGYEMHKNINAKIPKGNVKMIDSYLFDYDFNGITHECPYSNIEEMFDVNEIFEAIDKN